jgi:hypothetical protein
MTDSEVTVTRTRDVDTGEYTVAVTAVYYHGEGEETEFTVRGHYSCDPSALETEVLKDELFELVANSGVDYGANDE